MRAARRTHHAALSSKRDPYEPQVREHHARNDEPRMPPVREHYAREEARGHAVTNDAREPPSRDERADERIEVPAHRERAHLASTGHALPEPRRSYRPTPAAEYGAAPDNTRVNERDREPGALTPLDQSESDSDRDLLQRIRKAVVADDALSFTAKNVKIITRDGQVTLRGAVNNEKEKVEIDKLARAAAGQKHVTNELEVSR